MINSNSIFLKIFIAMAFFSCQKYGNALCIEKYNNNAVSIRDIENAKKYFKNNCPTVYSKSDTLIFQKGFYYEMENGKLISVGKTKNGRADGVWFIFADAFDIIATAKWFCNCSLSLRPADCVVKPRRCAASPAFYALSAELMKTDHFTKPLRGGYTI